MTAHHSAPNPPDQAAAPSAIVFLLISVFLFSCLDAAAKLLTLGGMNPYFIVWCRFFSHAILAVIALRAWSHREVLVVGNWKLQVLRACFLFGATIFNFFALRTLQLAETVTIFFVAPMVIAALAGPVLGEWAGWRRWLAILAGFVGVLVMARPGASAFQFSLIYSIASMLSYSAYVIMTRKMKDSETPESMIIYSAIVPSVLLLPGVPLTFSLPDSWLHLALLPMLGVFGAVGHWSLIHAYRVASTSALAPYAYFQMIWMMLFGYWLFDQLPDTATLIGASIIVMSGLYIIRREAALRRAANGL